MNILHTKSFKITTNWVCVCSAITKMFEHINSGINNPMHRILRILLYITKRVSLLKREF
jgi:hypothetical protein